MTDIPNDENPGKDRDDAQSKEREASWQPSTDAGSAKDLAEEKAPRGKTRSAPSGDATMKRRAPAPAPDKPAETEPAEGEAEPAFAGERIAKAIARDLEATQFI